MDHYVAHRADYTLPEAVSFRHMFFSAATRGADARAAAVTALGEVRDGGASSAGGLGDPPPVPPEVSDWTRPMVAERFGADFAASVFAAGTGGWSGPVASAYGCHLVLVTRRTAPHVPNFAEVAGRIATDLDAARRAGALDRIYATVRGAYQVEIEPAAGSAPVPLHEHAERTRA